MDALLKPRGLALHRDQHLIDDALGNQRWSQLRDRSGNGGEGQDARLELVRTEIAGNALEGRQFLDARRTDAVFLRQEPVATLAAGSVQVPIDGKRLPLTQLLQTPRHLGHLFGFRAGIAQRQGRRIHSLDLQLAATDERVGAHLGQRGEWDIDDLALSGHDEDAMLGSDQPLAAKAPVGSQIRRGADEHLLLSGQGGSNPRGRGCVGRF